MAGPFYFAWVDANTAFDPEAHNVEDEKIIQFSVEQIEGEFATLSIDLRNPRIGLLATGRKVWAWLSWDNGTDIVPLFFGRLVGLPSNIHRQIVTLQFLARPSDYGAQKEAIAAGLRELPYYDPVFIAIDKRDDPDVVLEGRTASWHIDRTSHVVTVSDMVEGEDGTLEFQPSEIPDESLDVSIDQPPVQTVHLEAEVTWSQHVTGVLNGFTDKEVITLAGAGLISGWPAAGADLGGGWSVQRSSARSLYANITDTEAQAAAETGRLTFGLIVNSAINNSVQGAGGTDTTVRQSSTQFAIINDKVYLSLEFNYDATRSHKERIIFDLIADSQPLITSPEDEDAVQLKISGVDVSLPLDTLDEYSEIPIGTGYRRSYFAQERGQQSIAYLMQVARANIIVRSRAVKTKFKCKLLRGIDVTLRKNAVVFDNRLPGGQATGKIIAYTLSSSEGEISAEVTMASTVGYGGEVTTSHGTPIYVDDDYVNDGYQFHAGETISLAGSDLSFEVIASSPNDDGMNFPLYRPPYIESIHVVTTEENGVKPTPPQIQASVGFDDCGNGVNLSYSMTLDTGPYSEWLSGIKTTVNFGLQSVTGGPFESVYQINVSRLMIPKQIDLEAAAL